MTDKQMTKQELKNLQHFIESLGWNTEDFGDIDGIDSEFTVKLRRPPSFLEEDYSFCITLKEGEVTLKKFLEEFRHAYYMFDIDTHVIKKINEDPDSDTPIKKLLENAEDIEKLHDHLADDIEWYIKTQDEYKVINKMIAFIQELGYRMTYSSDKFKIAIRLTDWYKIMLDTPDPNLSRKEQEYDILNQIKDIETLLKPKEVQLSKEKLVFELENNYFKGRSGGN